MDFRDPYSFNTDSDNPYFDSLPVFTVVMCEEYPSAICGINGPGGLYESGDNWVKIWIGEQFYPWLAVNYLTRGDYESEECDDMSI